MKSVLQGGMQDIMVCFIFDFATFKGTQLLVMGQSGDLECSVVHTVFYNSQADPLGK